MKPTKSEKKNAIALNREIVSGSQDINNVLSTSGKVSPLFHAHYTNMESGDNGISALIMEILKERDAVFPANFDAVKKSHYNDNGVRPIVIAASLFTREILDEVEARFTAGTKRYPLETVEAYLSVWLVRGGKVGKVKMTKTEDSINRPKNWSKPRCKWFLID